MTKRNPLAVLVFGLITLGIYSWYWAVKTKGELNKLGTNKIPTAWIWLIPIVGYIWWSWKYSVEVEEITHEKLSAPVTFLVLYFLSFIGQAIIQDYYNKLGEAGAPVSTPSVQSVPTTDQAAQVTQPSDTAPTAETPSSTTPTSTTISPTTPPETVSTPAENSTSGVASPTQPAQETTPSETGSSSPTPPSNPA